MGPILLLGWIGLAAACGFIASERGRNGVAWAVVAIVISPVLAYLILVAIPMHLNAGGALRDMPQGQVDPDTKVLREGDDSPVFRGPR